MFESKECGKKFKTLQELGGHAASAHSHPKENTMAVGDTDSMVVNVPM